MKKVIQLKTKGELKYHISTNPNTGALTFTNDIEKAGVFESDWDMTFIPRIKSEIIYQYPFAKVSVIEINDKGEIII